MTNNGKNSSLGINMTVEPIDISHKNDDVGKI